MESFDQLARTPAAIDALQRLRTVTGGFEGPMERHCLRVRHIAAELGQQRGWADGAELAREMLSANGWTPDRVEPCAAAIDRHHDLRGQLGRGGEVEALRLADLVDVSGGVVARGLDRGWLRALGEAVPRQGLGGELAREVGRALRERPLTLARIFWRQRA